jgi:tRNA-splicing ligase RtcB
VVSAGGVGFDISCGVRCLHTGLARADILAVQKDLADMLYYRIPAGVGSTGSIHLSGAEMDAMLLGGARWAVERGWGSPDDLERIEEHGQMLHAKPANVSQRAKSRQRDEMGTLGSGNHYLEVQEVTAVYDAAAAQTFGLEKGDIVVMIHCGSRGLGHQIGTEFLKKMAIAAASYGIQLPDRELACAPIDSDVGQEYLGAMRACAPPLTVRSPTARSLRTWFARCSPTSFRMRSCLCSTTSRTTPARWRSIGWTGPCANSTSTAKAPPVLSARAIRTYRRRCVRSASRC